ncbi:hypothetical protein EH223_03325 [candidate division KSB1 bacterium]|nr:hypothetical protein [candidate division KSB1 bacterium]RQW06009.1 MAG: hypothetical protein EH223_03325 [candidate division KSB1 bacterium]
MKKIVTSVVLWIAAFILTFLSAAYQRRTGPTYPIDGQLDFNGSTIKYELLRTHGGDGDQPVLLSVPDTSITADVIYRRYKTDDAWRRVSMRRQNDTLVAALPHQPPAGKLEYHVEIHKNSRTVSIPEKENAVTRFKGAVPGWALLPHVFFMFFAMFLSARTGLQAVRKDAPLDGLMTSTLAFLILGGFVFGPIVQKFAFGAFWTGFPFGMDLTDNKTLIALLAWLIAFFMIRRTPKARLWVVGAALVMLIIFLIPHSMHGSELDYSTNTTGEESMKQRVK